MSYYRIDVDIIGHRDDSNYVSNLKFQLMNLLHQNFPHETLKLTTRYAFKLYIDCILLSLTTYLALKTTRLPLLISDVNDEEVAEQPTGWNNLILDPSIEEEQVLENGLIVGLNKTLVVKLIALCNKYCPSIIKALDSLIEEDSDENDGSIF
ncbi:Exosome complex component RRP42 [Candida viswanathii]|uniref:Exosome complex component RRP42 n=1 Tax=Candida viswanathii TaxID=5486 RepID=A0A367Y189_9ASCO|nr:Exosome complex component RRP42 [Candida viswanathii]